MHAIDELERAPRIRHRLSSARATLLQTTPTAARAAETRIPTEKLVPYALGEEHEGGQHADKHGLATPGSDARRTTNASDEPALSPATRRPRHAGRRPPRRGAVVSADTFERAVTSVLVGQSVGLREPKVARAYPPAWAKNLRAVSYRQAFGASRLRLQYGCIALSVNSRLKREGARTARSKPSRPRGCDRRLVPG
jgi:hypothetical protein